MGPDPEGNIHSLNRYTYANNNPYKYVDPDGRLAVMATIAIATIAYSAYQGYQDGGATGAVAEASGYNDGVAAYNSVRAGDYSGAALAAGSMIVKPLKVVTNVVDPKRIKHIFRDKEGHIPDTPDNRKLLEELADNPKTTLGKDKFGNTWSGQTRSDGTQIWTQTRGGKIINGGVNPTEKSYNPETGLSALQKPNQK